MYYIKIPLLKITEGYIYVRRYNNFHVAPVKPEAKVNKYTEIISTYIKYIKINKLPNIILVLEGLGSHQ